MTRRFKDIFRWIVLVPGSLIGGILAGGIISYIPRIIFNEFIGNIIASIIIGGFVIAVASAIAPNYKRKVSIAYAYALTALLLILVGAVFTIAFIKTGFDSDFWQFLIYTGATIFAFIVTAYGIDD